MPTEVQTPTERSSLQFSHRLIGAAFVLVMLMVNITWMGRATVLLSIGLVVAYLIWVARESDRNVERAPLLPVYLVGIAVLFAHSCEEYFTGFQREFPNLFGYQWTDQQFVAFNLLWMAIFLLAALGVHYRVTLAYLVVWFFALAAGIGNGIGHLAASLALGRYFPGAVTAPLCLIAGIVLVKRLAGRAPSTTNSS